MFKKEKFPVTLFVSASILALIVFVALFLFFAMSAIPTQTEEQDKNVFTKFFLKDVDKGGDPMMTKVPNLSDMLAGPIINTLDPGIGNIDSPVYVVIYSDFKCVYCAEQEEVIRRAIGTYKDDIRFIWKDYPEADLMSDSFLASVAARCAQRQGNFWTFHDSLYEGEDLSETTYFNIARDLDLNMDQYEKCYKNQETRKLILDNMIEAEALGITGIPFMYVNDQQIVGKVKYDNLKKIIEIQLEKSKGNG